MHIFRSLWWGIVAFVLAVIGLIVGTLAIINNDDKSTVDTALTKRVSTLEASNKATAANVDKLTRTVGSLADTIDKRLTALDKKVTSMATSTVPPTTAPATTDAPSTTIDPNAPATTTPTASTVPPATVLTSSGTMPNLPIDASHGKWSIKLNEKIDADPIVKSWLARLRDPDPTRWQVYPNVPNPKVSDFRVKNGKEVPDGVEYGMADAPFCEYKQTCDWVVPAQSYRLITGDYSFLGQTCKGEAKKGCLILLFNVMDRTYAFRDQGVDNGFTVHGRYWNGDRLEFGAWGLVSHAAANMLNLPTMRNPLTGDVLNAGSGSNAGANCGMPSGCPSVDATIVVHAGDRILATAHTVITR